MIEKTEAIVLRSVKYQESSLISTLFTEQLGRVSVIARGARKPKSRFAAMLTPGQIIETVFHHKETRSVQTLTEADYLVPLGSLRTDVQKLAIVTTLCELLLQLLHENDPNESLFNYLKTTIVWIERQEDISPSLFPYMQIRIADKIGFGLQADADSTCDRFLPGFLSIPTGTVGLYSATDLASDSAAVRLTPGQLRFVLYSLLPAGSSALTVPLSEAECSQLIHYIDRYFAFHVDGIRPRKSDAIFEQLLYRS